MALATVLIAPALATSALAASLAITVPANVTPGGAYRITITGSFAPSEVAGAGAYLVLVIQYSGDRCASTATIESAEGLPLSYYLAPQGAQGAQSIGISETQSPFTRSDTLTATSSGARRVCAYLYPQTVGTGDSLAPIATADAAFQVLPGGGHGQVATDGRVGTLRIDVSSLADVVAFAGPPEAQGLGSQQQPPTPAYHALGYGCQRSLGNRLMAVSRRGPNCRTVFFINQSMHHLAAFFTSSPGYLGPGGIHPGMPAARAERRTHTDAVSGCGDNFAFGTQRTRAILGIQVFGGRTVTHRRRGGPPVGWAIGGRLGYFLLESTHHGVGLTEC